MKSIQNHGIHHIGFIVKDMDATLAQMKQLYCFKSSPVYYFTPTRAWSYGKEVFNYKLKISMISLDLGSSIEVIQPISGEGVHNDFVNNGNSGLHHICFCVDDYDYWRAHFKMQNAEFLFESETEDEIIGFRRCFYAEDKLIGTVYEIKEKPYFR